MNTKIQAIIGLGNPEQRYEITRHNAGFWFLDLISKQYDCTWRLDSKNQSSVADFQLGVDKIRLFKPTTYMNCSGRAISLLIKYYKLPVESILIAHDDIDIDPGDIRLKFDGGHGGHNGLKDIIQALGVRNFYRLRIGVGRPNNSEEVHSYVLQKPTKSQQNIIINKLIEVIPLVPDFLQGNHHNIMNQLHTRV